MRANRYKCLTCRMEIKKKNRYFPFCSKRCSLSDLDKWLREKYIIVGDNIYIKDGNDTKIKEE